MFAATAIVLAIAVAGGFVYERSRTRPQPGDYVGLSSQRLAFTLTVAPDRRTLTAELRWRCTRGDTRSEQGAVHRTRRTSVRIDGNGEFAWKGRVVEPIEDNEGRERLSLEGHRAYDGSLSGTWNAELAFFDGEARQIYYTCNTGPVKFRLARRDAPAGTDERGNRSTTLDADLDVVATGAGGPWVLGRDRSGSVLFRIDPATGRPAARTALRTVARPLLATGEGAAWVLTNPQGPPLGLARVDGRTHEVRRFSVPYRRPPVNQSLIQTFAVGLGGVWLHDGDRVLRLDPRTGRRTRTIRLAASTPAERLFPVCGQGGYEGVADRQSNLITLTADAVWVASTCGPREEPFGFLQRIDPRTNRVTRVIALRHGYSAMAADEDGIWAATRDLPALPAVGASAGRPAVAPLLHRLNLRSGRPASVTRLPAGPVNAIAVGAGATWLVQGGWRPGAAPAGTLARIDPASGRRSTVLRLERPVGVAVGDGGVWVLDAFARTLTRVRP